MLDRGEQYSCLWDLRASRIAPELLLFARMAGPLRPLGRWSSENRPTLEANLRCVAVLTGSSSIRSLAGVVMRLTRPPMPQRCFAREADALAFLNGNFTEDEVADDIGGGPYRRPDEDDARHTGGRGDSQVTWGEDARHTGGSTASGPLRLRLSQLSWLSSALSTAAAAATTTTTTLSDADQGGARRPRRMGIRVGSAWLCCCCGGGSADARDEVGGADNHEALLQDGQREEPVEAPGAARTAHPVPAAPTARVHGPPGVAVADAPISVSTISVGVEATETAATPCVHTVWGLRCPYKGQSCPWPGSKF